jgi:hypothetical protein
MREWIFRKGGGIAGAEIAFDCNENPITSADTNLGAKEICSNGVDDECNSATYDMSCAATTARFPESHVIADGDTGNLSI